MSALCLRRVGALLVLCATALFALPASAARPSAPFFVAPVFEGILSCEQALGTAAVRSLVDNNSTCAEYGYDTAAALSSALDRLEPQGPTGEVQIGYTIPIPLLALHEKRKDGWKLDEERVDRILAVIAKVERPVVIYLAANHFDAQGRLTDELLKDKRNFLLTREGEPPIADYFGNKVLPYTFSTDADIPVNRYRFEALRILCRKIAAMPRQVQDRIVAVTLMGELHQMFPDIEGGMGAFQQLRPTDYSPQSVAGFRQWLAGRYGSVADFNRENGFAYAAFDAVPIPAKDIRTEQLLSFGEHYDGFASGLLPVSGWLWDPARALRGLDLYLDGSRLGEVPRGFNRLDVYRAVEAVDDPNVGFRYDLPYASMAEGRHVVQVVGRHAEGDVQVAKFEFNIVPRDQHAVPAAARLPELAGLRPLDAVKGVRAWLDLPRQGQDVYFNPLARDWDFYRNLQVRNFLGKVYRIALEAGIPADKLYSHQLLPAANSTWNSALFAADAVIGADLPWHTGINLYGGATNSPWVDAFVKRREYRAYGVPEFNPQQWKKPGVHVAAMQAQRAAGARFISPYYMSITAQRDLGEMRALKRMEIGPDNKVEGSDAFYRAIKEFAAQ